MATGSNDAETQVAAVATLNTDRWSVDDTERMQQARRAGNRRTCHSVLTGLEEAPDLPLIHRLVLSAHFEICCAIAIVSNALFVGLQVQHAAQERSNDQHIVLQIGHLIFCVFFSGELALRIFAYFPEFFFRSHVDFLWNWFDSFIVAASILEAIIMYRKLIGGISTFLLAVRILRIVRLVRIIRRNSLFRELRAMVFMIAHTLKSLVWSLVLLFMLMYVFGLVLTQAVTNHLIRTKHSPDAPFATDFEKFFGSLLLSMLTLLHSLTGGISWREPAELLRQVDYIYEAFYIVFVVFTLFAMLNVITGFFCENAREMAAQDRDHVIQEKLRDREHYIKEMHALFKEIDQDGDASLSLAELEMTLANDSVKAYLVSLEINVDDVWDIFKLLDADGSGTLNIDEFADGCLRLRGQAKSIEIAALRHQLTLQQKNLEYFMSFVEAQFQQVFSAERRDHHLRAQERNVFGIERITTFGERTVGLSTGQSAGQPLPANRIRPSVQHEMIAI